jgi:hypothetical protein
MMMYDNEFGSIWHDDFPDGSLKEDYLAARGRTPFVRMAQQITEIATILVRRPSSD